MRTYKTVFDLSRDELNELKEAFFFNDETQSIIENEFTSPLDIPENIIFNHYKEICFVDDDFYCNSQ